MNESLQVLYYVLSGVAVLMVLGGLILQSKVRSALWGNLLALAATVLAIVLVIVCYYKAGTLLPVYIALGLGAVVGIVWAIRAKMIDMPQTVALLNGPSKRGIEIICLSYCKPADYWDVYFGLIEAVGPVLAAHGITTPNEQLDVNMKN